jgi:hypothetical protein
MLVSIGKITTIAHFSREKSHKEFACYKPNNLVLHAFAAPNKLPTTPTMDTFNI